MFKLATVAFCSALLSNFAFANDTSFAKIDVDAIDTNVAEGSSISFVGDEAKKLFDVLPAVTSAGGPRIENGIHTLLIHSPGYQVTLNCATVSRGGGIDIKPQCFIYFGRKVDEGNNFAFVPKTQCNAR